MMRDIRNKYFWLNIHWDTCGCLRFLLIRPGYIALALAFRNCPYGIGSRKILPRTYFMRGNS